MPVALHEVFGVSRNPVLSYLERDAVDRALYDALRGTRQIVIYGSSKQGKTSLLERHLDSSNRTTVHCDPSMGVGDLYRSILRQLDVEITTEKRSEATQDASLSFSAKFKAILPLLGSAETEAKTDAKIGNKDGVTKTVVEFNLEIAQDVGELLNKISPRDHFYVLENFHYLPEEAQQKLAFDLRTFEEMGLRFVILGVWRERNRLVQYNGDLQDRISEVPVEPWLDTDFEKVISKGEFELNIEFSRLIKDEILRQAHGSIAVVQELLKTTCEFANINGHQTEKKTISNRSDLDNAIERKVYEYSARHTRSLESIAAGSRTRRSTEETSALYLPYYFVKVMIERSFGELKDGIERKALQILIQGVHPQPDNVRASDITGMLTRLGALQSKSKIVPPLFDYDPGTRRVKVVDSTLYFFIDNCSSATVMEEIAHPENSYASDD